MKKILFIFPILAILLSSCTDANIASQNLSREANYFKIDRRIVFYNGINGEYMLTIEGKCSIQKDSIDLQLEVTCKTGDYQYKKHFLGISDNITYFVEQLEPKNVSTYNYKVIFKPTSIIPDIDIR